MTKEEFKQVCNDYVGTLKEVNDEYNQIIFTNQNRLITYYDNGEVCHDKKVECEIYLGVKGNIGAYEETGGIIGGVGCPPAYSTKEVLIQLLKRYNFQKIKAKQLSIFDL